MQPNTEIAYLSHGKVIVGRTLLAAINPRARLGANETYPFGYCCRGNT